MPRPEFPHLLLALSRATGPALVAHRKPGGAVTAGVEAWPFPPPEEALLLHWPARFPWTAAGFRCLNSVRETGGVALPLATVLRRMDMSPPRSMKGLLEALDVGLDEFEDPAALGKELITAVADILERYGRPPDDPGPTVSRYKPCPEILTVIPVVPESPGVYTFLAAESRPLYVGKAANLRVRVGQHFSAQPVEEKKSRRLARESVHLTWETTGSELEALLLEQEKIAAHRPPLNTMEKVHLRPRGDLREERLLLVLPSTEPDKVEVCLVSGEGGFHWERVPARSAVPRDLWSRMKRFLSGDLAGWAPRSGGRELTRKEMAERAEITLSWLARRPGRGNRIDLKHERPTRDLARRLRRMLAEDPAGERVEVR